MNYHDSFVGDQHVVDFFAEVECQSLELGCFVTLEDKAVAVGVQVSLDFSSADKLFANN